MSKHKNCKNCLLLTTALLNVSTTAAMEGKSPIIKQNEFIEPKVIDNVNPGLKVIESRTLRPRRPAMAKKGRALDKVLNNKSVTKSVGLTDATEPQIRVQSPRAKIPQKSEQRRLRKRGSTSPKGVADGTIEDAVIKRGFIAPTASARSTQTKEEQQAVKKEGISGMKRLDDAERSRKKVSLERIKAGRGRRGGRGRGRGGDRGTVKGETSAKKEAEEKAERNRLKKKISRSKDADLVRGKDKDAKMEDKTTVDLTVRSLKSGSKKPIKEPSTPIQELSGNDRLRRRRSASPKGRKKRKSPTRVAIDETKAAQSSTGSVKSTQTKEQAVKKEGGSAEIKRLDDAKRRVSSKSKRVAGKKRNKLADASEQTMNVRSDVGIKDASSKSAPNKLAFDATGSVESGSNIDASLVERSITDSAVEATADKVGGRDTALTAAKVAAKNKAEIEKAVDLSAEEKAEENAKEAIEDEAGVKRLEEEAQKSEDATARDSVVEKGTARAPKETAKKEPNVEEPAKEEEAPKDEEQPAEKPKQEEEAPQEEKEPKTEKAEAPEEEEQAATDLLVEDKSKKDDSPTEVVKDENVGNKQPKNKQIEQEAAKQQTTDDKAATDAAEEAEEQDEAAKNGQDSETRDLVVEDESQHDVSANDDDDDDDAHGESDSTSIQQLSGKGTISDQTVDEAPKEEIQTLENLATGDLDEDKSKNDDFSEIEEGRTETSNSKIQQLSGRESSSSDETVDEASKAAEVEQEEPSQTTIIIMIIAVLVLLFAMFCSST